ncbi:MscL family protein [Candidatus Saccharibacteria bacterium]|nr:MAG: MscL family protein [Candidatus Saccharibacteria bacterium]
MTKPTNMRKDPVATIFDEPDEAVKRQLGGFIHFLREKAVVGLAVGFIIGQQAQGLIKQLVDSFISPWMNIIVGSKLQERTFSLGGEKFTWGKFTYVLVNFLLVLLAIYVIIKAFKLDKLDLPKDVKPKKKK